MVADMIGRDVQVSTPSQQDPADGSKVQTTISSVDIDMPRDAKVNVPFPPESTEARLVENVDDGGLAELELELELESDQLRSDAHERKDDTTGSGSEMTDG
jgi:hypothetical protein